ncbi:hypothetical protein X777_01346 [Ooceraea biroi]|uniref:Uncharacterized protein n=1 Tax=Ooceraea biroi TaxID=2015173 RepID=A0A026WTF9_OOCBI|nr:hypothetical protein X777_01346 [Ooceraea biroi]
MIQTYSVLRTFFHGLNINWIVARNFHSKSSIVLVYDKSGDRCWLNGSTTDGACTSPDAASQRCRSIHPFFELHLASPLLLPTYDNSYSYLKYRDYRIKSKQKLRRGEARRGEARRGEARRNELKCDERRDEVWRGERRGGEAWRSKGVTKRDETRRDEADEARVGETR